MGCLSAIYSHISQCRCSSSYFARILPSGVAPFYYDLAPLLDLPVLCSPNQSATSIPASSDESSAPTTATLTRRSLGLANAAQFRFYLSGILSLGLDLRPTLPPSCMTKGTWPLLCACCVPTTKRYHLLAYLPARHRALVTAQINLNPWYHKHIPGWSIDNRWGWGPVTPR